MQAAKFEPWSHNLVTELKFNDFLLKKEAIPYQLEAVVFSK